VWADTEPFAQVEERLRRELLNQKAGVSWFAELMRRHDAETVYAPGFGPNA
jgi:hypothetical protein